MKKESVFAISSVLLFLCGIIFFQALIYAKSFFNLFKNYPVIFLILLISLFALSFIFSFSLLFGEKFGWQKIIGKTILIIPLVFIIIIFFLGEVVESFLYGKFNFDDFITLVVFLVFLFIFLFIIYKIIRFKNLNNKILKVIFRIVEIILIIAIILSLVVSYGIELYTGIQAKKIIQFEKDNLYLNVKCLEFCPYKDNLFEEKNYTTKIIQEQVIKQFDVECIRACDEENIKAYPLDKDDLFYTLIYNKYNDMMVKFAEVVFDSKYKQCVPELQQGDKSCLNGLLSNLVKYTDAEFISPVYESVNLEIMNLTCSDESVDIAINFSSGNIDEVEFYLTGYSGTKKLNRSGISNGVNEFKFNKEEYLEAGNVESIQIAYKKDGELSEVVFSKYCNPNL